MGLEQKRFVKEGKDRVIPEYQQKAKEFLGKDVTYEVDWESFGEDLEALQNLEHQGLGRIHDALLSMGNNEAGKEALRDGIKKIVVKNVSEPAKKKVTVKNGVVEVQAAYGKGSDGYFTYVELGEVIGAAL